VYDFAPPIQHALVRFRPETTSMQARLKVLHDKTNVKQVKLLPVTLIGRSTDCNLKIASSQVSRNHCRITLSNDTVFVEDLGSANGTLVDGQLLPPHQPTAIPPGARLVVGPAEFLIDYVAPTSATMVLSRSGVAPVADLPSTDLLFPEPSAPISVDAVAPALPVPIPVAASVPVAAPINAIPIPAAVIPTAVVHATEVPAASAVDPSPMIESPNVDSAETISDFSFAAADAGDAADSAEQTMFSFEDSSPPVEQSPVTPANSSESPSKKGGLKSLFSLFGRKERQAAVASPVAVPATPSSAPSVFLPTMDSQAVEIAAVPAAQAEVFVNPTDERVDETTETTELAGPESPGTSTEVDDGFQQFLQQL
jgi:hypothetical protein